MINWGGFFMNLSLSYKGPSEKGIQHFKRELNGFFDDFFPLRSIDFFDNEWIPSIDMTDDGKSLQIKADLPGLSEKDIEVTFENNALTISGEKKGERSHEDQKSHVMISERSFGSFRRTISLPQGVKADTIDAEFKNGVLTITVPKEEKIQSRKIEIKNN
jgi:HSP20 family protein